MAIGDIYRFSLQGDWGGSDQAYVTLHFKALSVGATPANLASALTAGFVTSLLPFLANVFTWRQWNYLSRNLVPPLSGFSTAGMPKACTQASDALPHQTSLVVTFRTAYAGRSFRGRMYLPAPTESENATGAVLDNTSATNLQAVFTTLVNTYGSGGSDPDWQLGIYSQKLAQFNPVTTSVVRTNWGTQRRRRIGVGI